MDFEFDMLCEVFLDWVWFDCEEFKLVFELLMMWLCVIYLIMIVDIDDVYKCVFDLVGYFYLLNGVFIECFNWCVDWF